MTNDQDRVAGGRVGTDADPLVEAVEEAFGVLGDDIRLNILLELTDVINERGPQAGLTFSELRSRVQVADSGRFNYHLNQLQDGFVRKEDDEYRAEFPGLAVVSAVYAGLYTGGEEDQHYRTDTDRECQRCSSQLSLHYEGTAIWFECPEHGSMDRYSAVPPGAFLDRTLDELAETVHTRLLVNILLARRGICLHCWGAVSIDYPVEPGGTDSIFGEAYIFTKIQCHRCWNQLSAPIRTVVATHPLVVGAFRDQGREMWEISQELLRLGEDPICHTSLHNGENDSPTATVRIDLHDGGLVLELDESCQVIDHEWR